MTVDGTVYAGTNASGMWSWNGSAWSQVGNSLDTFTSMVTVNEVVYAATGEGVLSWNGSMWSRVGSISSATADVTSLTSVNGVVYAGTSGYGVISWDGSAWSQVGSLLGNTSVITSLTTMNGVIYAGTWYNGVFSWDGNAWSQVGSLSGTAAAVRKLTVVNGKVYAGTDGSGLWSWDGSAWSQVGSLSGNATDVTSLTASNGVVYAGTGGSGLWAWNGSVWSQVGSLSGNAANVTSLTTLNGLIYAGTPIEGVFVWDGSAWSQVGSLTAYVTSLTTINGAVYAGTGNGDVFVWNGSTWSQMGGSLGGWSMWNGSTLFQSPAAPVSSVTTVNGVVYAGTEGYGVFSWDGSAWSLVGNFPEYSTDVNSMTAAGGEVYAGTNGGVFKWDGSTWSAVGSLSPTSLTAFNDVVYAGTNSGVFLWDGSTWSKVGSLSGNAANVNSVITGNGIVYAGTGSGVWSWLPSDAYLSGLTISGGALSPAFAETTTTYTDSVANDTTSVTVTPTTMDSTATVMVNGTKVVSGATSSPVGLNVGSNVITVVVAAGDGTMTKTYTVNVIRSQPLSITTGNLTTGVEGSPYSFTMTATGGALPYTWTASGLPTGLSLNSSTGVISGVPSEVGSSKVTVSASDGVGNSVSASLVLAIAPAILGVTPSTGPSAGGTEVTITGSGFSGVTGVDFGTAAASAYTVNSDTSITAVTPAGSGAVDVTVTGADPSLDTPPDLFTYYTVAGNVYTISDVTKNPEIGPVTVDLPPVTSTSVTAVYMGNYVNIDLAAGTNVPSVLMVQPGTPIGSVPAFQFTADGGRYSFNQPITITLPIPSGLTNPSVYYKDASGVLELITNGHNNGDGTITFTTDHFSTYVVDSGTATQPVASPGPGSYIGPQTVTLRSAGAAKILYYLTTALPDGFDYSQQYQTIDNDNGSVTVASTVYLVAIGVDSSGFASTPLIAQYIINSGGSGGGGGGAPPSPGTPIGPEAASVKALDGRLTVNIAAGALNASGNLVIAAPAVSPPESQGSLAIVGEAYQISLSGITAPEVPMTLQLSIPGTVASSRVNLVGIYTYSSTGWQYVGGKVDPSSMEVSGTVYGPGIYSAGLYDVNFPDVPADYWAVGDIATLVGHHLISGMPDGTLAPEQPLTRAQFAKLIVLAMGLTPRPNAAPIYRDVAPGDWDYGYVAAAQAAGLIQGYNGSYDPDAFITREQMATIIVRALQAKGVMIPAANIGAMNSYRDATIVAAWAQTDMGIAIQMGLIRGMGNGDLGPLNNTTRAQSASVIVRILKLLGQV